MTSLDWSAEGYQMWLVNASKRPERPQDPEFMPFPTASEDGDEYRAEKERQKAKANPLANKALIFQFVKSPISVNPGMTKQEHIYLQVIDGTYICQSHLSKGRILSIPHTFLSIHCSLTQFLIRRERTGCI